MTTTVTLSANGKTDVKQATPEQVGRIYRILDRSWEPITNARDVLKRIDEVICERYGIEKIPATGRGDGVYLRRLFFYFARQKTRLSLKQIGEHFGGFDHTSVRHGAIFIALQITGKHPNQSVLADIEFINEHL